MGAATLQVSRDLDLTHGVAITSSIHPTSDTHIEPVRYGKGSNAMGLLQTLMTDGSGSEGTDVPRWKQLLDQAREDPRGILRMLNVHQWSERTVIALVMQHLDNSITTFTKRGKLGIRWYTSKQGHGEPNPTWIPVGNEVTRRIADKIDGVAGGTWGELFNIPLTAHFLGGAVIGDSPEHGVIDPYHRVYGYPTLFVVDGAAISANLGVNPSLSITAQAERAASLWPNKGAERPAAAAGRHLPPAGSDRARSTRWCPSAHRVRCAGCRSTRSARRRSRLAREHLERCAADHPAAFAVHVDGHIAHQGDAVHEPRLAVVVVDRPVLGCPVVPDGNVTLLPIPANGVLGHGDSPLQQFQQHGGLVAVQADEVAHEISRQQGAFTGLRVHPHHGVFGSEVRLLEGLPECALRVGHRCD